MGKDQPPYSFQVWGNKRDAKKKSMRG